MSTTVVSSRDKPETVGQQNASWLLHGLEFELSQGNLTIFNALDQNGVSAERSVGSEFRRTPV
jgi:hypothetical protein